MPNRPAQKETMKASLLVCLLCLAARVEAEPVYSWTDANGVKHFSETPPPASVINVQKLNVRGDRGEAPTAGDNNANLNPPNDPNAANGDAPLAAAAGYSPDEIKH